MGESHGNYLGEPSARAVIACHGLIKSVIWRMQVRCNLFSSEFRRDVSVLFTRLSLDLYQIIDHLPWN